MKKSSTAYRRIESDRKYFDMLEDEELATLGSHEYYPTEKLIEAIKCWREANEGNQ